MDAPGPPRFVSVGDSVELAPRSPDPDADYRWTLLDAPADSSITVDDGPVVEFEPNAPGHYQLELETPDETHLQTVRAYPSERHTTRLELPFGDLPESVTEVDSMSVVGPFNKQVAGRTRPTREDDRFVVDLDLLPGTHSYGFCVNDDFTQQVHGSVTVPGPGRPRCRLDAEIQDETLVVTATATAAPDTENSDDDLAVDFVVDDRDWLPDSVVEVDDRTLRVPVESVPETLRIHAVAVGERRSVSDTLTVHHTDDALSIERPNDPPAWAESPTVYEIFVRSFTGETLPTTFEEIERRVEYLNSLAVDVLWLTPVLASPTDHGYHITDYFETADDLGSREAFESLVDTCHEAGIRVVFDLVINHTSRDHSVYQLHAGGVDRYDDYYKRVPKSWDGTGVDWAGDDAPEFYFNWQRIPNLNYGSLAVRRWMLDVVDEWADVVDGFRCDVAWGVPHSFWKEVRERVPDDFLLLDETIPRDPHYHEAEFHMHYDTALYGTLREIGHGEAPATKIFQALNDAVWQGFPESAVHLRYIENHDEERYLDECSQRALRAAVAATFTLPGAPMIYYGQERGMTEQRGPMKWHDGDAELTDFHRSLSTLRREYPVLKHGAVEPLSVTVADSREEVTDDETVDSDPVADDEGSSDSEPDADVDAAEQVVAFARDDGTDRLLVVCNFADEPQAVSLPEPVSETDLRTTQPLKKRYPKASTDTEGERDTSLLVDDVVICRAR
ncbi:glycosidase [Halohasta litchfieldiae]|jgi:glycosidase|uniref:Glycosidase n=1 Tax=Halohasta litchfieldiae TaxID=1073996 RepID=A0A1H6UQ21_9EURY|nr:alpha-amylase family glycosyl hydrolase [Halohasta litchfieldiae]ATW88443.1 glycosidase [Halohasta litchfieldiae]SEI94513.1 Glycosidase [Halohasta litchfieldiae]